MQFVFAEVAYDVVVAAAVVHGIVSGSEPLRLAYGRPPTLEWGWM